MASLYDKAAQLIGKLARMSSRAVYLEAEEMVKTYAPEEIDFYWRKIVKGE